jgi:16S rRNA (cytosine967-C5)-methyltransferase
VARFLAAHPDWHLAGFKHPLTGETVTELQLLPQRDGVDGFYLALLERKHRRLSY